MFNRVRKLSRVVNFRYAKEKSVLVQIKDSRLKISENVKYRGEIINYVVAASPFFFYSVSTRWHPLFPPSPHIHTESFCLSVAFFRDANYVKYSHDKNAASRSRTYGRASRRLS